MNPYKVAEEESFSSPRHCSYEDIATKLLRDHYFLTALELHTELVECGKELPQLREFFSNPGNFEQHVSRAGDLGTMQRSPSLATLDSLDTARYSEDGGGDRAGSGNDVAVLEFELRKAKETINSLRANLTQFAEGPNALEKGSKDKREVRLMKPHEKRALNFLINEYLLLQDYKLTSITFSDENPDQDFEDWDDIGLNMPRPTDLVSLVWDPKCKIAATCEASTQIEEVSMEKATLIESPTVCVTCQNHLDSEADWNHELLVQTEEITLLKQKITALETDKLNFQKLYDAAIVSLNALTTPVSENKTLDLRLPDEKLLLVQSSQEGQPITSSAMENHYGSENSNHSVSPEQFEMIENYKQIAMAKESSNESSFEPANLHDTSVRESPRRRGSVVTLDDAASFNEAGDWARVYDYTHTDNSKMWIDSGLPPSIKELILSWCAESVNSQEPLSNDLLAEYVKDKPVTLDGLLLLLADTLPRIIPHTLASKRCEAAALLACTIHLLGSHDEAARKVKLIQMLITLLKKPEPSETRVICEATCLIVKWGGSGEVLSSIAELLASRSTERRILASQICLAIAPYVSIELCTSLLLSLVILMCESSENDVRSLGLKAACLICPTAEHKYGQMEDILFNFIKDPVEKNVKDTVNIFLPVLARSALMADKFSTDLYNRIKTNLIKSSTDSDWKLVSLYLNILNILVLPTLAYIVNVQIIREYPIKDCDSEKLNYEEVSLDNVEENCLDLKCYISEDVNVKCLFVALNQLLNETPDVRWKELDWFISLLKQLLQIAIKNQYLSHPTAYSPFLTLINYYIENLPLCFTKQVVRPVFLEIVDGLELKLEKLDTIEVHWTVVVGTYLVAVLPALGSEEVELFMQKWIMYSSLRNLPLKIFSVPLKWVAKYKADTLNQYLRYLRELSASSRQSESGAAIRVYIARLLAEFLNTTEVSENNVERELLPAVEAMLHDDDVSVREHAITSWGSITRTAVTNHMPCAERCWACIQTVIGEDGAIGGRASVPLAEALSLCVLPDAERQLDDTAVSLLCAMCTRASPPADCLPALTAGLQLIAHHATEHPALMPALRKLEEYVKSPHLAQYKPSIDALIHNVTGTSSGTISGTSTSDTARDHQRQSSNLQAAQDVGRRVTQMFQQSKTNIHLPNLFKKKS